MAPIVILGAGVIGCSTAYYLTESQSVDPMSVHLIEASPELFASASGKAGGFLASDWFGPSTASLGALSFRLHEKLALENDGKAKWGYSPSTGASFTESDNKIVGKGGDDWLKEGNSRADVAAEHEFHEGSGPAWLTRRKGDNLDVIAQDETVAQVDPLRLSRFLLGECVARGVQLHQPAKAVGLTQDSQGQLIGVKLQQQTGTESEGSDSHFSNSWTRLTHSSAVYTPPPQRRCLDTTRLPDLVSFIKAAHPHLTPSRSQHRRAIPALDHQARGQGLPRCFPNHAQRLLPRDLQQDRERNLCRGLE